MNRRFQFSLARSPRLLFSWLLLALLSLGLVIAWKWLRPQSRLQIVLPFDTVDEPYAIYPMGETVNHPPPVPHGHPGIDFQWNHEPVIRASAAGVIEKVEASDGEPTLDVYQVSGAYSIRYKEITHVLVGAGDLVTAGQPVGKGSHPGKLLWNLHWELTATDRPGDRLCPLSFLTPESHDKLERIWAGTQWQHKDEFPLICNGYYEGKDR